MRDRADSYISIARNGECILLRGVPDKLTPNSARLVADKLNQLADTLDAAYRKRIDW